MDTLLTAVDILASAVRRKQREKQVNITNTNEPRRHPWPDDMFVQGGDHGVVISKKGNYYTAFVEAFPPHSFIRGEGATIEEAETNAWNKFVKQAACGHEYEPRGYTNGAALCKHCNNFHAKYYSGEDLGQFCSVCGVGTTWATYSPHTRWDADRHRAVDDGPESEKVWFCEDHAPFRKEFKAWMHDLWGNDTSDDDFGDLTDKMLGGD